MTTTESRAQLFQTALRYAEWTERQLWLQYLALGGTHDVFDLDTFLHDLAPMDSGEQNVLAVAVNERLDDVYQAAKVPYILPPGPYPDPPAEDVLQVLSELLPELLNTPRPPEATEEEPV